MVASPAFELVAAAGRDYSYAAPPPTVPVTVAWGTRDRILWPRQARRAAELLPRARHVWLYRCGHVPMIDEPDRVASVILDDLRVRVGALLRGGLTSFEVEVAESSAWKIVYGPAGDTHVGVLTTLKRDGRPQLSNVGYVFDRWGIRISVTDGRAKTATCAATRARASTSTASSFGSYVVAEGVAELTPVAKDPNDATVDELVDVYRSISGEHPDWDEFRAAMVDERRLVVRIPVDRVYGMA